jgi:hypothetical protein
VVSMVRICMPIDCTRAYDLKEQPFLSIPIQNVRGSRFSQGVLGEFSSLLMQQVDIRLKSALGLL